MPSNRIYRDLEDLPAVIPVFPLSGALLLPRGQMPLNIFEPRYLAMVDDAIRGERIIGMIQPRRALDQPDAEDEDEDSAPLLCDIGCIGRITAFQETGDGRVLITLTGISRFQRLEDLDCVTPYRQCRVSAEGYVTDLAPGHGEDSVNRDRLLDTFRAYLDANNMDADWESIARAGNEALVNALSMMSPYGPREKQALLEAEDLVARAEILIAMTEMVLKKGSGPSSEQLQ